MAEREALRATHSFHFDYLSVLVPLLTILGMGSYFSHIRVTDGETSIRMGWAFTARIPHSAVRSIAVDESFVSGIGVHGWGPRWLVNGSHRNIVRLEMEPGVPARVCGVPLTLRTLRLGVAERDAFISAVRAVRAEGGR